MIIIIPIKKREEGIREKRSVKKLLKIRFKFALTHGGTFTRNVHVCSRQRTDRDCRVRVRVRAREDKHQKQQQQLLLRVNMLLLLL